MKGWWLWGLTCLFIWMTNLLFYIFLFFIFINFSKDQFCIMMGTSRYSDGMSWLNHFRAPQLCDKRKVFISKGYNYTNFASNLYNFGLIWCMKVCLPNKYIKHYIFFPPLFLNHLGPVWLSLEWNNFIHVFVHNFI